MKTVTSVGIALALMLSVVPAMAGETDTFQAFSKMAAVEQARLTLLSDEQLVAVEGSAFCFVCLQSATNIADIRQYNIANVSGSRNRVEQDNDARVRQRIRQRQF